MLSRVRLLPARIIRQHMPLQAGSRLGPYEVVSLIGPEAWTVGSPIPITAFRSPAHTISPNLGDGELSVAPRRLALPILEASGSVWMLDNVDR